MRICFWYTEFSEHEVGVLPFDDTDGTHRVVLELLADEIVTESSWQWPSFGDYGEQRGYVLYDRNRFDRLQDMWPDLEYYSANE
jgi:hypothetical protein